jgi:hypothetical protein
MSQNMISHSRIDKTVLNLYMELKDNKIVLTPPYQRGKVWNKHEKQSFIDSVYMNILPIPIIFNNDNNTGLYTCMDGLQRITALYQYINNEYYVVLNNIKVYYSRVPKNKFNNKKYRKLTHIEKNRFDSKSISVIVYDELTLNQQYDIFTRINEGKKLSDEDISEILSNMNEQKSEHEELLETLNTKIKTYQIPPNTVYLLSYIIFTGDKKITPFTLPRSLRDKNKFKSEMDIKTEITVKNKIVKLFENKIFNIKQINKNVILGITRFIAKYNMYDNKHLKQIVKTVSENGDINSIPSRDILVYVYKLCKRINRNYTRVRIQDIDTTDSEDIDNTD